MMQRLQGAEPGHPQVQGEQQRAGREHGEPQNERRAQQRRDSLGLPHHLAHEVVAGPSAHEDAEQAADGRPGHQHPPRGGTEPAGHDHGPGDGHRPGDHLAAQQGGEVPAVRAGGFGPRRPRRGGQNRRWLGGEVRHVDGPVAHAAEEPVLVGAEVPHALAVAGREVVIAADAGGKRHEPAPPEPVGAGQPADLLQPRRTAGVPEQAQLGRQRPVASGVVALKGPDGADALTPSVGVVDHGIRRRQHRDAGPLGAHHEVDVVADRESGTRPSSSSNSPMTPATARRKAKLAPIHPKPAGGSEADAGS